MPNMYNYSVLLYVIDEIVLAAASDSCMQWHIQSCAGFSHLAKTDRKHLELLSSFPASEYYVALLR